MFIFKFIQYISMRVAISIKKAPEEGLAGRHQRICKMFTTLNMKTPCFVVRRVWKSGQVSLKFTISPFYPLYPRLCSSAIRMIITQIIFVLHSLKLTEGYEESRRVGDARRPRQSLGGHFIYHSLRPFASRIIGREQFDSRLGQKN